MTDRDRLAADLHDAYCDRIGHPSGGVCHIMADRLIALGWTRLDSGEFSHGLASMLVLGHPIEDVIRWKAEHDMRRSADTLDEERLARALDKITDVGMYPDDSRSAWQEGWNAACIAIAERLDDHAAVAKAYREDTE